MERTSRFSRVVPLLMLAVAGLGLVFGVGVGVGWATRARRPPAPEESAAEIPYVQVKQALAACKHEMHPRKIALAFPPAPADAGPETAARYEALREEVIACRGRETLANAHICASVDDHGDLYDVLINGTPCEEKAGVGEYRVKSLERCAAFEDFPAHLDRAKLKKREKSWIDESKRNHALHWKRKDRLVEGMQYLRRECRKRWALPAE